MAINKDLLAAVAALIMVAAGLAFGYRMLGPPGHQRDITADEHRVADLRTLAGRVAREKGKSLPETLAGLDRDGDRLIRDPMTNAPYEYTRDVDGKFRLCATFSLTGAGPSYGNDPVIWDHPPGHHCYSLDPQNTKMLY